MAISISRSRVKEKCSVTGTSFDATIDNLIAELVPVIEHAIKPEHIADTGNSGLQDTLELGMTEIVCGEFLEQLARAPGAMERVRLGDFELWPPTPADWQAALSVKDTGWARLKPYLRSEPFRPSSGVSSSSTSKSGAQ
jgi:hypothetical protein